MLGSISATLHLLNDESRKYFHRLIAMSGTANIKDLYVEGDHRCVMELFAKKYNQSGNSVEELIEWLKYVPANDINQFFVDIAAHEESIFKSIFNPIIECLYFTSFDFDSILFY